MVLRCFMVKFLPLILLLFSCGNDNTGSSSSGATTMGVVAADPYIVEANFFYDQNNNGIWDQGELISSTTDSNGNFSFSSVIPAGGKIIQLTQGVMDGFNYNGKLKGISNGASGIVLNPLTTMIVNGFTEDQVVGLLESVGIIITPEQIYQNPMTDPNLLRASMTIASGLLASMKGFELRPSDISASGTVDTFNDGNLQDLFNDASYIYGKVITSDAYYSNLTNLSKVASSFLNFINSFGTEDFPNDLQIENAKKALYSVVSGSINSFEPIPLERQLTGFSSKVVIGNWFQNLTYDLIGFQFLNMTTRQVDETITNYSFSPYLVDIKIAPSAVSGNQLSVQNTTSNSTFTFDSVNNLVHYAETENQTDGNIVSNYQQVDGLPISTLEKSFSLTFRGMIFNPNITPVNEMGLRLAGSGNAIFTYYGIDWGAEPKDRNSWRVNKSRTNNCIENGFKVTEDCSDPLVTNYYQELKENGFARASHALTDHSNLGEPLPSDYQLNFSIKEQPLGSTVTFPPINYKISQIIMVPAKIVLAPCYTDPMKKCMAVKVDGEDNPRPALEDYMGINFINGYENFPDDYQVYAINEVVVKTSIEDSKSCRTDQTSSFFKANMMVLKLNCQEHFPEVQYLFMDFAERSGIFGSYPKEWFKNNILKFRYRDFNWVNLKNPVP